VWGVAMEQSITKSLISGFLICLVFFGAMTGCGKKTLNGDEEQLAMADYERKNVLLIEKGEGAFFYPMSDGYFYPVEVPQPEFIETIPLKVKVLFLHKEKSVAVVVEKLRNSSDLNVGTLVVEYLVDEQWKAVTEAHWKDTKCYGYLEETDNLQQLDNGKVRVMIKGTNK
jgi:hypothetical protein